MIVFQYDTSRIGDARREAIRAMDDYGCTIAEQSAAFGVSEATFHRYARDVRLRRRHAKVFAPGCVSDPYFPEEDEQVMPPADALEIATIALIRARANYSVAETVEALHTSKSAVYRQKKGYLERLGAPSPAEKRWFPRHLPSHLTDYKSRAELTRDAERRYRCWTSRPRNTGS